MTVVHVDFNDLARGGKVVALRSWADGPVSLGDQVLAVDKFDDELQFDAIVAEEDPTSGEIYLAFDAEYGVDAEPDSADQVDHVIYSMDDRQTPQWSYRLLTGDHYGLGASLEEVRALYRTRAREVPGRNRVIEHVERRLPPGYWLRYTPGDDDATRSYPARVFIGTTRHNGGVPLDDLVKWGVARDGEPLVIACLPEDTIESVLDQITEVDSAIVTMVFDTPMTRDYVSAITSLSGAKAARPFGRYQTLADAGLTARSTIRELMEKSGVSRRIAEQMKEGWRGRRLGSADFTLAVAGDTVMVAA